MKRNILGLVICLLWVTPGFAQKTKMSIIKFSISGNRGDQLYFIGYKSTELRSGVYVSDEIVKYTEAELDTFFGKEVLPTEINRPETIAPQTEGKLWVMKTISQKQAYKQFGCDEVIEIECKIMNGGVTFKYYKPLIEMSIKVTDREGNTIWKKKERLKIDENIPKELVQVPGSDKGVEFQLGAVGIGVPLKASNAEPLPGVTAERLLNWYKQILANILIP